MEIYAKHKDELSKIVGSVAQAIAERPVMDIWEFADDLEERTPGITIVPEEKSFYVRSEHFVLEVAEAGQGLVLAECARYLPSRKWEDNFFPVTEEMLAGL